jgi:hypothetical protein
MVQPLKNLPDKHSSLFYTHPVGDGRKRFIRIAQLLQIIYKQRLDFQHDDTQQNIFQHNYKERVNQHKQNNIKHLPSCLYAEECFYCDADCRYSECRHAECLGPFLKLFSRRHDITYNDIQYNDTQHTDIQYYDTQHNIIKCSDIQHRGLICDTHQK